MTDSYHVRYAVAPFSNRWARRFVVFAFASALGGCSVSMPMAGLIDETPTSAIASKATGAPNADAPGEKRVVQVAAAQPEF
jgi:hypothetical protein